MPGDSAETKTGWLSASDSATSFLALRDVVADDQKYTSIITRLEQSIEKADAEGKLTLLVKHVYALQLEWIKAGKSGQIETFMFARSLVPLPESTEEPVPAKKKHCFVLLSGIQVKFTSEFMPAICTTKNGRISSMPSAEGLL